MAVGTDPLECYQDEDVSWEFTVSDPNIANLSGWTLPYVIKQLASSPDPPLISGNGTVTDTLKFKVEDQIDLAPGTYFLSVRRGNTGFNWQLVHAPLTVLDSASID